ncbi:MAG: Gfo/Idh/MocA family oxidoreductase [Candidatus Margulisiibacteriota bacterium]
MQPKEKIVIAQIGLGNWGKNLLLNFSALSECYLKYGCDLFGPSLEKYKLEYPQTIFTPDLAVVLGDNEVKAVVIATSAPTHYAVAKQCLENGKHVFIEKPITLSVAEASELLLVAKRANKKIMVGHLLLYHPAITKLKKLITAGELGMIQYIYTQRLNLGTIRNAENALWSLAPHDISVVLHLLGRSPQSVSALGAAFLQPEIEDLTFVSIRFDDGAIGHVHVSWLDPTKTRRTVIVGDKKMAIFDELLAKNNLVLVDKGVDSKQDPLTKAKSFTLRNGPEQVIEYEQKEPLKIECQHFIDCIKNEKEPLSSGENGLAVLKVLAAAERSLKNGGSNEIL